MCLNKIDFSLSVEAPSGSCPVGERWGSQNAEEGKIPVISCEGACIRGEIARLAANMVAAEDPFGRGCHGEMFTVPGSAIARWMREAEKVVVIDGCFLHCHGRIMKNLIGEDRLMVFDALTVYRKYTDIFHIDDVPEEERKKTARQVADKVIAGFGKDSRKVVSSGSCTDQPGEGCCGKDDTKEGSMDERIKELIAIGASIGANCHPCIEFHIKKSLEMGIGKDEIQEAVDQAKAVRRGAAASMDKLVLKLMGAEAASECGDKEPSCCCS